MRKLIILLTTIAAIAFLAVQVEAKNRPKDKPRIEVLEYVPTFLQNKEDRKKVAREARECINLEFEVAGRIATATLILKDKKGDESLHTFRSSEHYMVAILYPETMSELKEDGTFVGFFAKRNSTRTERIDLFILFKFKDADDLSEKHFDILLIGNKQPLAEETDVDELSPDQK